MLGTSPSVKQEHPGTEKCKSTRVNSSGPGVVSWEHDLGLKRNAITTRLKIQPQEGPAFGPTRRTKGFGGHDPNSFTFQSLAGQSPAKGHSFSRSWRTRSSEWCCRWAPAPRHVKNQWRTENSCRICGKICVVSPTGGAPGCTKYFALFSCWS